MSAVFPQETTIIIRAMTEADIDAVHAIDTISFSLPWPKRSYEFELKGNPAAHLWVAEWISSTGGNRVVGMIVTWWIVDEVHIATLAVLPEFRNHGIGERLLRKALVEARKNGAFRSLLEVRRGNLDAQNLYRKYGYKVVAIRPHYYRDNGEDAFLMDLDPIPDNLQP